MICNRWSTRKNQQFRIDNRNVFQAEFICQFKHQPLSETKRAVLVPVSAGSCMAAPLGSQPITAYKCVVVLDGSLAPQGIDTCSGLEPLIEPFNEKRNNSDVFYKCCPDYMAFFRPRAGYRLVSLIINCAETFKGARTGHRMAFTQRGSMNNRDWIG